MAVVNITGGTAYASTNQIVNAYTCPTGRSARVEVVGVFLTNTSNQGWISSSGIEMPRRMQENAIGTVYGKSLAAVSTSIIGGSTDTFYIPSGQSLKLRGASVSYVAIEEDDG